MEHTISALVENKFGVLARVAGLFSSRGFNITSLAVGETEDPTVSRMTIVVDADERILEQVVKQLRRLIDVIKVQDLTSAKTVERELVLVKVVCAPASRGEICELADIFRARIVDVGQDAVTLEATGDKDKIEAFLRLLRSYGIRELVRTGKIAIARSG